jgi:hypothetical protein
MRTRIIMLFTILAGALLLGLTVAQADESLPPGDYSFTVPGAGELTFSIAEDGTVSLLALPDGYKVEVEHSGEHDGELELKLTNDALSIELEIEDDEFEFELSEGDLAGDYLLTIPGVGQITVAVDEEGVTNVTAPAGWNVYQNDGKWFITDGNVAFQIEVEDDEIKVKATDDSLEEFLNSEDDDDDHDEEGDDHDEDDEDEDHGDDQSDHGDDDEDEDHEDD